MIVVEVYESNAVNKRFVKGGSLITLVFTATDLQVMPSRLPLSVTIGGTPFGVRLISNVAITGSGNKARRYSYEYTVVALPLHEATLEYAINELVDAVNNHRSVSGSVSEVITIGMF